MCSRGLVNHFQNIDKAKLSVSPREAHSERAWKRLHIIYSPKYMFTLWMNPPKPFSMAVYILVCGRSRRRGQSFQAGHGEAEVAGSTLGPCPL